jgi:hypothetical protein
MPVSADFKMPCKARHCGKGLLQCRHTQEPTEPRDA